MRDLVRNWIEFRNGRNSIRIRIVHFPCSIPIPTAFATPSVGIKPIRSESSESTPDDRNVIGVGKIFPNCARYRKLRAPP